MSRKTSSQILTQEDTPEAGNRPFLSQSQSYRVFVQQKRKESQRIVDDLKVEIDGLETQIQSRMALLSEHQEVVAMCDASLAIDVTANPTTAARIEDKP